MAPGLPDKGLRLPSFWSATPRKTLARLHRRRYEVLQAKLCE